MRRHNRLGLAGFAAVAAAVLAAAGCSSSSSSSAAATSTSAAPASSLPASTGTGGQGAQSVTNYLTYTGGKAGPADKSLPPVYIGYVNQQGGPTAVGLLATAGAQMAVNYANAELGGVGGHPIQLVTCFIASAEEEGTVCAQKFLANKKVNVIELGGVAIGVQSFFGTLGGAKPVIDGVAATPVDSVQKNAVILFGDATHILAPFGTYAKDVLHAKTAALVYPSDNAGIAVGAAAIKAGLVAAGISVKAVGYPETQTDLTSVLTAAGAQTADMVIPYSDTAGCVNLAKSLKTLGITDTKKIVSAPLCLNGQVIKGLGDFPHWTYSIASSLFGDPSDPGMPRLRGGGEEVLHRGERARPVEHRQLRPDADDHQDHERDRLREPVPVGDTGQGKGVHRTAGARRSRARLRQVLQRAGRVQRPYPVLRVHGRRD